MVKDRRQAGFSLTETLLAVGTLAVGLMFISGTFLTGVFFATTSTERTVAAVAAEEALAKMRIYGLDPNALGLRTDTQILYTRSRSTRSVSMPAEEYLYPSTRLEAQRQYSWAALCRRLGPGSPLVQCTVFVSRQSPGATYWSRSSATSTALGTGGLPQPVRINIVQDANAPRPDEIALKDVVSDDGIVELTFVNDGSTLVDDKTGEIYRVLERYGSPPDKVRLDRPWTGGSLSAPDGGWVWVVPPATSGGRNPVVGVYQDVIRFAGN